MCHAMKLKEGGVIVLPAAIPATAFLCQTAVLAKIFVASDRWPRPAGVGRHALATDCQLRILAGLSKFLANGFNAQ